MKTLNDMKHYIEQHFEQGITLTDEHLIYLNTQLSKATKIHDDLEALHNRAITENKQRIAAMQERVMTAEVREKAQIERQKAFGESQTKVEEARHKNIKEEIRLLTVAGVTVYNRSSYPLLQRHEHQKNRHKIKQKHIKSLKEKEATVITEKKRTTTNLRPDIEVKND